MKSADAATAIELKLCVCVCMSPKYGTRIDNREKILCWQYSVIVWSAFGRKCRPRWLSSKQRFKYEAQIALFKDPVRTAQ